MNPGTALLTELAQAGLTLEADGDRLVVAPRGRLTDEIRATIRAHKADLLAAMAVARTHGPSADWVERAAIIEYVGGYTRADADRHARQGWNSGDWRRWIAELVSRRITRGDTPVQAEGFAYGAAISEWHACGGTIPAPGTCAGCGGPVAGPLRNWPDGASIHGTACSIRWVEHWHRKAAEGLLALGIEAPPGWAP